MTRVHQRWLIRCDLYDVVAIDNASFDFPWSEEDFLRRLRRRNVIGMVAEVGDEVVGHFVYAMDGQILQLLRLAVHPSWRRDGVGRQMMGRLQAKLTAHRRPILSAFVRETNLGAQLFFRACGLRADAILPAHFSDTGEDAYLFRYGAPAGAVAWDHTGYAVP